MFFLYFCQGGKNIQIRCTSDKPFMVLYVACILYTKIQTVTKRVWKVRWCGSEGTNVEQAEKKFFFRKKNFLLYVRNKKWLVSHYFHFKKRVDKEEKKVGKMKISVKLSRESRERKKKRNLRDRMRQFKTFKNILSERLSHRKQ